MSILTVSMTRIHWSIHFHISTVWKWLKYPFTVQPFCPDNIFQKLIGWINSFTRPNHTYQIKFTLRHFSKNTKTSKWSNLKFSYISIILRSRTTTLTKDMSTRFKISIIPQNSASRPLKKIMERTSLNKSCSNNSQTLI